MEAVSSGPREPAALGILHQGQAGHVLLYLHRYFLTSFDYPNKRADLLRWDERIIRTVEQELHTED
jgi:hypothetical protein